MIAHEKRDIVTKRPSTEYDWHDKRNKLKQQRLHNTPHFIHISSSNHFSISNQSKTNRMASWFWMAFKKQRSPLTQKKRRSELFVIEVLCSCNRFSMEDFLFVCQPLSFYVLVGIFEFKVRFVIVSHATKRGYGMHTCALHFTVLFLKCTTVHALNDFSFPFPSSSFHALTQLLSTD